MQELNKIHNNWKSIDTNLVKKAFNSIKKNMTDLKRTREKTNQK